MEHLPTEAERTRIRSCLVGHFRFQDTNLSDRQTPQVIKMRHIRTDIVFVLAMFAFAGCGETPQVTTDVSSTDSPLMLASIVESFSDKVGSPQFIAAFADGSSPTPDQEKSYHNMTFEVVETPYVSGDTAKVKVKVIPMVRKKRSPSKGNGEDGGSSSGERNVEWTLVKTKDGWKIKNAPVSL